MSAILEPCLNQLFINARTHSAWRDEPVSDDLLRELYHLTSLCPTSANCSPMRVLFLKSKESKERLRPFLAPGNMDKTMKAPVTALIGYDLKFYEHLPYLFPYTDAKAWYEGNEPFTFQAALLNGSLQGAYLILAARALGLDCGPMSGFDAEGATREFFADTSIKANFLCNLGHGDPSGLPGPRAPRLDFDQACEII